MMPKFRSRCQCLADVVYQVVDELNLESRYLVEIDIPDDIALPTSEHVLRDLIQSLISQTTALMAPGGELAFIGWESEYACELEIADSVGAVTECRQQALAVCLNAGVQMNWSQCPQGGAAVTMRFAKSQRLRNAA